MAMTPQERNEFNEMKRLLKRLLTADDPSFIQSLERRLDFIATGDFKLSDLSDVSGTDGASTGQVLKKTATTWQPGTDNIA